MKDSSKKEVENEIEIGTPPENIGLQTGTPVETRTVDLMIRFLSK